MYKCAPPEEYLNCWRPSLEGSSHWAHRCRCHSRHSGSPAPRTELANSSPEKMQFKKTKEYERKGVSVLYGEVHNAMLQHVLRKIRITQPSQLNCKREYRTNGISEKISSLDNIMRNKKSSKS